jgi:Mn-dependent DtxR family transcriptional regulator
MDKLTEQQNKVLEALRDLTSGKPYPPTLEELAKLLQRSKPSVRQTLDILKRKGLVTWERGQARTLHLIERP